MRLRLFRKNSRHQQLVDLYRGAEEGSPTPDASPSSHQAFEDDQKLIAQLTQLSASAAPSDPSPERGKLLSRVAELKSAEAAMEAPIMRKILQMRTLAAIGAAVVLVAGAATVGASGGVSDAAGNVGDALAALNIIDKTPDEADGHIIDAMDQPDVAGGPPDGLGPSTSIEVCHVPSDNPDNAHTISVGGEDALNEHLAHGDSEGACADDPPPGPPDGVGPSAKVDICHVPDDNPDNAHTISVGGEDALNEHLAHGDSEGACADDPSRGPSAKVEICHVPDDNPDHPRTISVGGEDAVNEHLAHGDSEGPCDESDVALDGPNNDAAHPDEVPPPTQANEHATDGAANADGVELPDQADDHAVDGSGNPSLPDAVPDTVDVPLP